MIEFVGYTVLVIAVLAVLGVFIKVLMYALDALTKNDD
jgi:hypothetical protein